MRFYQVSWHDRNLGTCVRWTTSKAAARQKVRDLKETYVHDGVEPDIYEIDIPQQKQALCAWLNTNFTTDNG